MALAASMAACAASPGPGAASTADLEEWQGEHARLFADGIDAAAVGFALDGHSPAEDPFLPERTRAAELVARMKVQTVTRRASGDEARYLLGLRIEHPALVPPADAFAGEPAIEIVIPPETLAFGLVSSVENSLRGRTFIGFVRRFAGQDGPVLHWHLTADTSEVAKAVQDAASLEGN